MSGNLVPLMKKTVLTAEDTLGFIAELLPKDKKEEFLKTKEIDFSYSFGEEARFRGNAFISAGLSGLLCVLSRER